MIMKTINLKSTLRHNLLILAVIPFIFSCDDDESTTPPVGLPEFTNPFTSFSINENKPDGELVATITATTPDFPDEAISFSISSGNENNVFSIDPSTGDLSVNDSEFLNYEVTKSLSLTLTATNAAGSTDQQFDISLLDLEDERYLEYTHPDDPSKPGEGGRPGVNVSYGPGEHQFMSMWQPLNDEEPTNRPVILFAGGGTFGNPSHKEAFWGMANNMSQRGYVTAYVYFTRVNDGCGLFGCNNDLTPTTSEFLTPYIQNIQDLRGAIRFLRKNADTYGINPDQVYVGGWSTGGNIMFQSAMMDDNYQSNSDSPEIDDILENAITSLGGIEGDLNPGFSSKINAIMSMMTSTYDLSMIDANDPPLLLINHVDAATGSDCKTGDKRTGSWTVEFPDGVSVTSHGTDPVYEAAKSAGIHYGDEKYIQTNAVLTEDMDYGYLLMQGGPGGGFCPNTSVLTSANYNFIANFYYRVTTGK